MNCRHIKKVALELALKAGKIQKAKFRRHLNIRWKSLTNPVTEVDQACEALIAKGVRKAFPDHAMLGEEGSSFGPVDARYQWIVDPLDGTVNYSHGLPMFCVSIGIYELGKPLIGVVHAPLLGETYVAERGQGAFLNGKRIRVSRQSKPLEAVLASGFSYHAREDGENIREWQEMIRSFQAIRRMGAAALDLCMVASGRFDGFWEYGLKAWDCAAANLILEEAGGKVSNIHGKAYELGKPGIIASNGRLHAPLVRALKRALARKLVWPPR